MTKFNKGDTISIEATVAQSINDGSAYLCLPNGLISSYFGSAALATAKLVSKAPVPQPPAGSVIEYLGYKYIVNASGALTYIDSQGNTTAGDSKWNTLMYPERAKVVA